MTQRPCGNIEDRAVGEEGRIDLRDLSLRGFGHRFFFSCRAIYFFWYRRIFTLALGSCTVSTWGTTTTSDLSIIRTESKESVGTHLCLQYWHAIEIRCLRLGESERSGSSYGYIVAANDG